MACDSAQKFLQSITINPALQALQENAESRQLVEQLQQDVAILKAAPKLRIGAARRLQGAASRRQTAAQALFDACAAVRRRVKLRYRGPKHAQLRRDFGEGLAASPAKPETVLNFAELILSSAPLHVTELRQVRVGPPTINRIVSLKDNLKEIRPERMELRVARRKVSDNLVAVADRVNTLCNTLALLAKRICPPEALSFLPPPPKAKSQKRA